MSHSLKTNVSYTIHTGRTNAGITVVFDRATDTINVVYFIGKGAVKTVTVRAKRVRTNGLIATVQAFTDHHKNTDELAYKTGRDCVRLLKLAQTQTAQL